MLEAEEALGYHSSGRSVSFSHYGIGGAVVRAPDRPQPRLLRAARLRHTPVARTFPSLYFADEEISPALDALEAAMARLHRCDRPVDAAEMAALCPPAPARRGCADSSIRPASSSTPTLSSSFRPEGPRGGRRGADRPARRLDRAARRWLGRTESGELSAPILVNAAGAWARPRSPLSPASRRSASQPGAARSSSSIRPRAPTSPAWPFVHSAAGDFYMLPEAGRLLVSPVDEVADDPCDAQPDDYDIALAADRLEHYTTLKVTRIAHRWAGLRTFTADRVPTAGFAPDAPGFFWLAGQGGYGFQTAPAMAEIAEALITGAAWPKGLRSGVY